MLYDQLYSIIAINTNGYQAYSQKYVNMPEYKSIFIYMDNTPTNTTRLSQDTPYQCPECGLKYKEREWAEKCEAWCEEHKSCNLEITAHAEKEGTTF